MKNFKLLNEEDACNCKENNYQEWNELQMQISKVQFRLDGVVNNPQYYRNILDRIELLGENDEVVVTIDSVGGDLDGCIALCDVLQATEATVTGVLVNRAYSAGAYIALCCDNIEVRPNARMMLHSFSGGFAGKDHEIELDYTFNKQYIRDFLSACCEGFLTEDELHEMYNGKDFWMAAPEIIERLNMRQIYNEENYSYSEDHQDLNGCDGGCQGCNCNNDEESLEDSDGYPLGTPEECKSCERDSCIGCILYEDEDFNT